MSHRILYLDDLGEHDITRIQTKDNEEEKDRKIEYTFTYEPNKNWSILTGAKGEWDYRSRKDDSDWVKRELFFKVEYHL